MTTLIEISARTAAAWETKGWLDNDARYQPAERLAWVLYLAECAEDSEALFPLGKWGTIQAIEDKVRDAAKELETDQ